MDVILAGYSLDHEFVEQMMQGKADPDSPPSPETLSAAYARISRYPEPVTELRALARRDVGSARKSNRIIVFGMGHHSVAEHVQLNFDILGVSRLALEALEDARLCSYTEKSQRYITLEGDLVVPSELGGEERVLLQEVTARQVALYKHALPILHEYHRKQNPDMEGSKRDREAVEGWAKEDARYALSLATEAQLGFSANARNLEHVIRKLRHHPLAEVRQLSRKLYEQAARVVPSLIILSDPEKFQETFGREVDDGFLEHGRADVAAAAREAMDGGVEADDPVQTSGDVKLLSHTMDPDVEVASALLFEGTGRPAGQCRARARALRDDDPERFQGFLMEGMKRLTAFDPVGRAFETATFTFELELSASCFAQLKRHRISTQIKGPYDPRLPCTVPDSVVQTSIEDVFQDLFAASGAAHEVIRDRCGPHVAEYVLTNAHRRRVLFTCNLREVYHLARIRMDHHAQWDIRRLSADMVQVVQRVAPVSARLACGKDGFASLRSEIYGEGR